MESLSRDFVVNKLIEDLKINLFYANEEEKNLNQEKFYQLEKLVDDFYDETKVFVGTLNEIEVDVFRKAYNIKCDENCYTLTDIAKKYNISLSNVYNILRKARNKIKYQIVTNKKIADYEDETLNTSIWVLHLPGYISNILFSKGINKVGDLVKMTCDELCEFSGINEDTCKKIEKKLKDFELELTPNKIIDYSELEKLSYEEKMNLNISELGLDVSLERLLWRSNICCLNDFTKIGVKGLKNIRSVGKIKLEQIDSKLRLIGLCLEDIIFSNQDEKLEMLYNKKDELEKEKETLLNKIQLLQQKILLVENDIEKTKKRKY
ncbi:MAG: hypothetical protein E7157_01840 [Lactobacillales bacterium]|nr:hypothetical protein [Lactobacillales bacterium]